jgi:hypothetical protein
MTILEIPVVESGYTTGIIVWIILNSKKDWLTLIFTICPLELQF